MAETAPGDISSNGARGPVHLRSLRVAFIAGTLGQGGAERQLYYIVCALRRAGANVRLFCLTRDEFWENRIRDLGVEVEYVGRSESRTARLATIVSSLRKFGPELIQSQHFYTNLYAGVAGRLLGVQEIGAIRNDVVSEVRANGRFLGSLSLRLPRNIAANSRLGISNARSLGVDSSRLHFLPNVVDTEHFQPQQKSKSSPLRLLVVGRLVEQKRMDRFVEVLARLNSEFPGKFTATIVGAGSLRDTLEVQRNALGLSSKVLTFVGAAADMRSYYQQSDVLVLTSEWEGTPNVLLEAMASGLAVVSTKVGGVADIVTHNVTGMLVEATEKAAIVAAFCDLLERLSSNHMLRGDLSERARQFVVEHHSIDALPEKLGALYQTVLT